MRDERYEVGPLRDVEHDMTWKEHLESVYFKIIAESQSVDQGTGSGQERSSRKYTAKYRNITAFAYKLMRKEQERQNDNQRLLEEVLLWLKRMPSDSESGRFKTPTDLFSRAKLVLKKER